MTLTCTECKNAQPRPRPYKLNDNAGLYLEVSPNRNKHWRQRYTFNGKENRIALGKYPIVTLAEAREKRDANLKLLSLGIDPSNERKEQKRLEQFNASQTVELVAREWWAVWESRWSRKYAQTKLYHLETYVFPKIGRMAIGKVKASDFIPALRVLESRGLFKTAKKVKQTFSQVMDYSVQTDRREYNFVPALKGVLRRHRSTPFASIKTNELPGLLSAIKGNIARLFRPTVLAILLMLLTFVRTRELIEATWDEFNFEKAEWLIPAHRMKMGVAHTVPLARQAIGILREQRQYAGNSKFVFPSVYKPGKPMSNGTILKALERMGYKGRMTGHGFRSLAMTTIKEQLGYRHEVVDRQLAHAPGNEVDRAYDRAQYLSERREMMQKWADYIDSL
ncbi:tyrosine-type recombinase/integrase [Dawidia soli]|uniref:Tyrosine-type recombinase/integrase n=1 Tax=Dawidia soli TaxID=2782352 RepID=A0AAP2DDR0_9BACT|nr:integrase arm-type DNA-binding domain-containing protein [Dawidia soli]MBT1689863.1 tyrosine-type recombinase/integrase [Dawidia soli]